MRTAEENAINWKGKVGDNLLHLGNVWVTGRAKPAQAGGGGGGEGRPVRVSVSLRLFCGLLFKYQVNTERKQALEAAMSRLFTPSDYTPSATPW